MLAVAAALGGSVGAANAGPAPRGLSFVPESLNGYRNNPAHPRWGVAGSPYRRLTPPRYADGIGKMEPGPSPRYISNRIFNSVGVDLFSARYVSQWGWVWGQFLDHTFGMAETGTIPAPIAFNAKDPLEAYRDDSGEIDLDRDAAAPGTGRPRHPRLQVNTEGSYIDAASVYGQTQNRLNWLRQGPDDGNRADLGARLMLPGGYLPEADARHAWRKAPYMQAQGLLQSQPQHAVVAGDIRADDNAELTAVQTLFTREHNRIVGLLPRSLPANERFQIARRVVAAEQQYITYTQFLPALGVKLAPYRGYRPSVDPELYDEFSSVGYRAHSMVNGEEHMIVPASQYSALRLARIRALGITVQPMSGGSVPRLLLTVSQNAAFFDPSILPAVGLGPVLRGLAEEPSYRNDAQIDDALRSVLFEYPGKGIKNPDECFVDPETTGCFQGVTDLGAIDVQRERDDGMPTYNELRQALGLAPQTTFTQLTGESTEQFPAGMGINDPQILDVLQLRNVFGQVIPPGSTQRAVSELQATTLAARLKGIYGSVQDVDPFVGMMSEPHVPGTEFGQLQLALWREQFTALRDGDRFFYARDPVLRAIRRRFGITYKHTLGQLISLDAGVPLRSLPRNVFFAPLPLR